MKKFRWNYLNRPIHMGVPTSGVSRHPAANQNQVFNQTVAQSLYLIN